VFRGCYTHTAFWFHSLLGRLPDHRRDDELCDDFDAFLAVET
jgi:hypothetical protein